MNNNDMAVPLTYFSGHLLDMNKIILCWMEKWYMNILILIYIKWCYKSACLITGLGFVEEIKIDPLSSYDLNKIKPRIWNKYKNFNSKPCD